MATQHLKLFDQEPAQRSVKAGEHLFKAGDAGDFLYVLLSGSAEILVNDVLVENAEPGAIIGEMALIDSEPRSASVLCSSDCQFAVIDHKRFEYLVQQTPFFAVEVMRIMGQRLRRTDKML